MGAGKSPEDPDSLWGPDTTTPPVGPPAGWPVAAALAFTTAPANFCTVTSRPWKMEFLGGVVGGGGGGGGGGSGGGGRFLWRRWPRSSPSARKPIVLTI